MKIHSAEILSTPPASAPNSEARRHAQCPGIQAEDAVTKCRPDAHQISILPGKIDSLNLFRFGSDVQVLVSETLKDARSNSPMAAKLAMQNFRFELQGMTLGEIDEVKDVIVKRMASSKSSQSERDVLAPMYQIADAAAENRMPSPPWPIFQPKPLPLDPGFNWAKAH